MIADYYDIGTLCPLEWMIPIDKLSTLPGKIILCSRGPNYENKRLSLNGTSEGNACLSCKGAMVTDPVERGPDRGSVNHLYRSVRSYRECSLREIFCSDAKKYQKLLLMLRTLEVQKIETG